MSARRIGKSGLRRGFDSLVTYVVSPKGVIKTIRYHYNVSSPLLAIETGQRSVKQIDLSMEAKDAGYAFLEDLYLQPENPEERFPEGWQAWLSYQAALAAGELGRDGATQEERVGGRKEVIEYDVLQQFPEEMLPKEVLRRRGKLGKEQRWEPPTAKGGKSKSKKAESKKAEDDGGTQARLA